MESQTYQLRYFSEPKSIAIVTSGSKTYALEPPFLPDSALQIEAKQVKSNNPVEFDHPHGLTSYLQLRNSQFVASSVRPLLQKICARPEMIKGPHDLQDFLEEFIADKMKQSKPSPHLPLSIQVYRTLFDSELFCTRHIYENAQFLSVEKSKQLICQQILVMSKHERFNYSKWIIPTLVDIENRWIRDEKFEELKNWSIFIERFSGIDLDPSTRDSIKRIYKLSAQEAKRLQFIADGRHKVKEWQKGAPIHR